MKLTFTALEACVLLEAASQMEDDAVEHYGRSSANALTRALAKIAVAISAEAAIERAKKEAVR